MLHPHIAERSHTTIMNILERIEVELHMGFWILICSKEK
jgi:hypothetical protein